MFSRVLVVIVGVFSLYFNTNSFAEELKWGDLQGQILFEGEVPQAAELTLNKDAAYCGARNPHSEKLLVDSQSKGLSNVVVYLYLSRKASLPPIHPSYEASSQDEVLIDNLDCRFTPHVTLFRTSQTLKITNSDEVAHNTAAFLNRNNPFNAVTPVGKTVFKNLTEGERLPVQISCSIHPWMQGWMLVQKHPYMAVTDENGNFKISHLPAGKWTFQFWHESAGYLKQVIKNDQKEDWKRGRIELEIPAGKLDLGTLKVPAEIFNR